MASSKERLSVKLEEMGPEEARRRLNLGSFNPDNHPMVLGFIKQHEEMESKAALEREEERDTESLSTAKEANRIAERALNKATMANIWAAIATLIAAISAVIATKDEILKLIFG